MNKKIPYLVLVIFLMLLSGTPLIFSFRQASAPLPPNISIDTPDPSLPAEASLLIGKWAGQWDSKYGWDCLLYVEKVGKDSARVVYSWGEYNTLKMSCHCEPNWARVQRAKVIYGEGKATIQFITPPALATPKIKKWHTMSGENEGWPVYNRWAHGYNEISFTVEKNEPSIMKGRFMSGKNSPLDIRMKKID